MVSNFCRRRGIPVNAEKTSFVEDETAGVGALGDIGCYSLDLVLHALDDPKPLTVTGYISDYFGKNPKYVAYGNHPELAGKFGVDDFGAGFIRLHCLATVFMAFTLMLVGFFQAISETRRAFVLSIIRKGIIDIPLMYLMDSLVPMYGVIACQPMTDLISAAVALLLYFNWRKKKARIV